MCFYIIVLFAVFSFALGIIVFLSKNVYPLAKVFIVIICTVVFLISTFLIIDGINGYRIRNGSKSFIRNMIDNPDSHQSVLFSSDVTENKKKRMQSIMNNFPNGDYKIEFDDTFWGGLWIYKVYFDNDQSFYIVIDASKASLLTLFTDPEYCLSELDELNKREKLNQSE